MRTYHEYVAALAVIHSVRGDVPVFSLRDKSDGASRAPLKNKMNNETVQGDKILDVMGERKLT